MPCTHITPDYDDNYLFLLTESSTEHQGKRDFGAMAEPPAFMSKLIPNGNMLCLREAAEPLPVVFLQKNVILYTM